MSSVTHTPGQWYVHEIDSRVPFPIEVRSPAGTAYRTVALLRSLTFDRADAHLIAAAPELLAALKVGLAAYSHSMDGCDCEGDCDDAVVLGIEFGKLAPLAIAKAEGVQP